MKQRTYIWSAIERLGVSGISLLGNVVLALLLSPSDFGLIAMLGVFTSLVYALIDCGLADALLREEAPSNRDFNTLFYFNVAIGLLLWLVFVALAPMVAHFFAHPELQPIMSVLGASALFTGLSISQAARLRNQLHFQKLAFIGMGAIALALLVAVVMAWRGCGYWALVELQVGYAAFYFLFLLVGSHWSLRLEFDLPRFKQLWQFGANLLLSTIFTQVTQNILAFVLGKFYNPMQAGYMGQAQKMQQAPVNAIEGSISNAGYVLAAQSWQPEERQRSLRRSFALLTLSLSAACCGLLSVSAPLVTSLFPERWQPVIPYLRLLLCWGLVYPLNGYMMMVFKLAGRTALVRNVQIIEKSVIVAMALSLSHLGIPVMILSFVGVSLVSLLVCMRWASLYEGISWRWYVTTWLHALALMATAGFVAWMVTRAVMASWFSLVAGLVTFTVAAWAFLALAGKPLLRVIRST